MKTKVRWSDVQVGEICTCYNQYIQAEFMKIASRNQGKDDMVYLDNPWYPKGTSGIWTDKNMIVLVDRPITFGTLRAGDMFYYQGTKYIKLDITNKAYDLDVNNGCTTSFFDFVEIEKVED